MNQLPPSTVKLISSTQVITSIFSVVKELVENSLDAGCDSIDIKLEQNGLGKIEIQDNGSGISSEDVPFLCKPHYTSKIKDDSDLLSLLSYGFRGEALYSICSVAEVSIITKTEDDYVSKMYTFNDHGDITAEKPTHHNIGTIISVENLFKNLPVRRQIYSKNKKVKEELTRIEELLISYGLSHPKLRITLRNDKNLIWRKNRTCDYLYAISELLGRKVNDNIVKLFVTEDNFELKILVPKQNSDPEVITRATGDRIFILVNDRPVAIKELKTILKNCCKACYPAATSRWPMAIVYIKVKSHLVDVNLEPNKTTVLLNDMDEILEKIKSMLDLLYQNGGPDTADTALGNDSPQVSENNTEKENRNDISEVNSTICANTPAINSIITEENRALTNQVKLANSTSNFKPRTNKQNSSVFFEQLIGDLEEKVTENPIDSCNATEIENPIDSINDSEIVNGGIQNDYIEEENCTVPSGCSEVEGGKTDFNVETEDALFDLTNEFPAKTFDLVEWSRGKTEDMTPVKVLQPQNINCAFNIEKKRKQTCAGLPSAKKVCIKSPVTPKSSRQRVLPFKAAAEMKAEKCSAFPSEISTFDFKKIENNFTERSVRSSLDKPFEVVGKLDGASLWALVIKCKLFFLDNARLSEKLIYNKLLVRHKFDASKLEKPIQLTRDNLGDGVFARLSQMETESSLDTIGRIVCLPLLKKNGILIKRSTDSKTGDDLFEWTHRTDKIVGYGINDLIEIIEEASTVSEEFRPRKVKEWCQSEATRISQISPEMCSSREVEEKINQLKNTNQSNFELAVCLHNRSIMVPVKTFDF